MRTTNEIVNNSMQELVNATSQILARGGIKTIDEIEYTEEDENEEFKL